MARVKKQALSPRALVWVVVFCLMWLGSLSLYAQTQPGRKVSVGILPFDDLSGGGITQANAAALARLLRAELIKSGKLIPRLLTLPADAALPLEPEQAAELGRAAKVDLVLAPTVVQAQAKQSEKGLRTGRRIFGVPLGGGQMKSVSAEVKFQVEMIRSADAELIDVFTVEGKKTEASVAAEVAELNTDLSSSEVGSASFQSSPLGQALQEAVGKLATEVESRSEKARTQPEAPPGAESTAPATPSPAAPGPAKLSGAETAPTPAAPAPARAEKPVPVTPRAQEPASRREAAAAWNLAFRPFSADLITTQGKKREKAKIYANEKASRVEKEGEGGQPVIGIMRLDRNVLWSLVPAQKMYVEIPLQWGRNFSEAVRDPKAKVEREELGSEQVGPYNCIKYRVRVTYEGNVYSGIQWAAKELGGFVVKIVDEKTKSTVEYQNIRLGSPDPALFEIPPGYQKMTMPGVKLPY